jgi:hypothetical protein
MTITRIGTTQKYAENWEQIFGGGTKKAAGRASASQPTPIKKKKSSTKKSAKIKTAKNPVQHSRKKTPKRKK